MRKFITKSANKKALAHLFFRFVNTVCNNVKMLKFARATNTKNINVHVFTFTVKITVSFFYSTQKLLFAYLLRVQ